MVELLTKKVYRQTLASIVASIQPKMKYASLLKMVHCGVTIFRINLSWFRRARKENWITKLRDIEKIAIKEKLVLGIMLDTKGPEFRVRDLQTTAVPLDVNQKGPVYEPGKRGFIYKRGQKVILTLDQRAKTKPDQIAVEAPANTAFLRRGQNVVFGDGNYVAAIESDRDKQSMFIRPLQTICVWEGAKVNFPGTEVSARALSAEDQEILKFFIEAQRQLKLNARVNFMFAQSFIKTVRDVQRLTDFLQDTMDVKDPIIIAKLETFESSENENLHRIINEASAVMIARGDLANETSRGQLPRLQRQIIKVAKQFNKPVLLATQVYGSMKDFRRTNCDRPEAEDVRSALELGVDGFVLTGELTERPRNPELVVEALAKQIKDDEDDLINMEKGNEHGTNHYERLREVERIAFHQSMWKQMREPSLSDAKRSTLGTTDFAIAAVFRGNQYGAIGIFPFTVHGHTVREMGRFYPEIAIFPICPSPEVATSLLLCRCTHPVLVKMRDRELEEFYIDDIKALVPRIVKDLRLRETNKNARYAICTMAHPPLQPGGTDTLLRIRIDEVRNSPRRRKRARKRMA
jgi:pyruvate kinase